MVKNVTMKGRDTIAAKLAECYLTINTRRYNFMQMIDLEAKVDKDKTTVPCLGRVMKGHKSCGMEGTFSGTAHYNQSELRQALLDYKNTGEDVYFEIQLDNLFRALFIFILFRAKDAIGLTHEQIAPAIMPFKVQDLWNRQLSFQP